MPAQPQGSPPSPAVSVNVGMTGYSTVVELTNVVEIGEKAYGYEQRAALPLHMRGAGTHEDLEDFDVVRSAYAYGNVK